ncbi:hypothetical protein PF008_g28150, partial [Phytophthora fragariae]
MSRLSSFVSGVASSFFNLATHSATRALSSSPFISNNCIVSSVGTQVPSTSRAGSFSRRPSTFSTATRITPSRTVSTVGASSRCRLDVGFGRN